MSQEHSKYYVTQATQLLELIRQATGSIPPPDATSDKKAAANEPSSASEMDTMMEALNLLVRASESSELRKALLSSETAPKELKGATDDIVLGWIDARAEVVEKGLEKLRREKTLRGLIRPRAFLQRVVPDPAHPTTGAGGKVEYTPQLQPAFTDGTDHDEPAPIEHHDVLMIAPKGVHAPLEHYRFPVRKGDAGSEVRSAQAKSKSSNSGASPALPERVGAYFKPPELMDVYDIGQRHTNAIAHPEDWGNAGFRSTRRGPAVSTIPIKPEPGATACITCYLINAQNLNYRNAWTAEEWNEVPDGPDLPPARHVDDDEVEMLIGGPRGLVFHIELEGLRQWTPGERFRLVRESDHTSDQKIATGAERGTVTCVDLSMQTEVWQQLRNGGLMGRVLFDDDGMKRVVPLVNITTLAPK